MNSEKNILDIPVYFDRITNKKEMFVMAGRVLPENGMVGGDVKFDRIRRITGYLVGTTIVSTMRRERGK